MNALILILLTLVCAGASSSASSVIPFRPRSISVDYGRGGVVVFTFELSKIEREAEGAQDGRREMGFYFDPVEESKSGQRVRTPWEPGAKIVKAEFIFSNGRKAEIRDIKDVDLIDVADSKIETLGRDGDWALSVKIKNSENVPLRVSDDRVIFIFRDFKYIEKRIEINGKWSTGK